MTHLHALILGLVEGITEFLPVSSTGHLILFSHFLGLSGDKIATFEIFIQLGAILSVIVIYPQRFLGLLDFKSEKSFKGWNGLFLLGVTTFPALVIGGASHHWIKEHLFKPETVAIGLGVGGIAMIIIERLIKSSSIESIDELPWKIALGIGFFQCLALWPGMSRSAATIIGAMLLGLNRKTAAEYSFFAAVPLLSAAVILDLYKSIPILQSSDISIFGLGFLISFISAYIAIRGFIKMVSTQTLSPFGWYRIVLAILVLAFI